ncbi:hypothetical protein [Streptomyces sp. WAC01280]|uniref:hypothetical protein n=1 Tax=Streptomyces sp. WAC01280 TaxID=2487424 RepID=UPI00163BEF17|nr:hypothetical protein [Streptomyces sp. WAC01280]
MPMVSIDSARERLGYGIPAEETYWCSLGILVQAAADAAGEIDWGISVDSTVVRALISMRPGPVRPVRRHPLRRGPNRRGVGLRGVDGGGLGEGAGGRGFR